jgi:formiminotetrahydrofolate cyclodeaminase
MDSNPAGIFILVAVLIAAVVGVVYLLITSKHGSQLNVQRYQTKWLEIENSVTRDNTASWQLAIMNADKLLDQALRERRFRGQTMGERMKSAQKTWKNANHVWGAHKIRNQLAHEVNANVTYDITLRSLSAFKQGLKDLGAI